jgi:uncharacterized protein
MKPVLLDTSGIIALLHRGDPHHERAKELAAQLTQERRMLLTTTAVLAEAGDGFVRKKRWHILNPFLVALAADPTATILAVDRDLFERARQLRESRLDKDWGLTDCLSFVTMTDRGVEEAFTADHHFPQAGFRALLLEP